MAASNTRYLPDVALLAVATFYIIRAVHPPHFAAASDRVDAKKKAQKDGDKEEGSGDVLSSMGFTSLTPIPIQAAFILASLWSTKALLSGKAWRDVSAGSAGPPVSWRLLFAFGNILTMLGGIARLRCYRELGKFFTFDLAVQKGQKVRQGAVAASLSAYIQRTDKGTPPGRRHGALRLRPTSVLHVHPHELLRRWHLALHGQPGGLAAWMEHRTLGSARSPSYRELDGEKRAHTRSGT